MSNFINLHCHSIYSIRDSIAKVPELVGKAKAFGHSAMAITDHGTLGAALEVYSECNENDIKPIIGCEVYVSTRHRTQKVHGIDKYYHLTLLVMNQTGWKNLTKLVTMSYNPDFVYIKPRIDRELLAKYNEGLICLTGCLQGNVAKVILKDLNIHSIDDEGEDDLECAHLDSEDETRMLTESYKDVIGWHKKIFGDRLYLEVQHHGIAAESRVQDVIFDTAGKLGLKTIATGDTHFVEPEDEHAHDIMLAIRSNCTVHDEKMQKIKYSGDGYFFPTEGEMLKRFPGHSEAVHNTMEIAERCNIKFDFGNFQLPHIADLKDEDDVFIKAVEEGLKMRFGNPIPAEIMSRAMEEITVIIQMTFPSYFLMVSDYIKWAKKTGIPVGPGRGSAAGSIVAYALEITEVNPLEYDLSFARFLNSGRASIPQIDFPEYPFAEWKLKQQQNSRLAV